MERNSPLLVVLVVAVYVVQASDRDDTALQYIRKYMRDGFSEKYRLDEYRQDLNFDNYDSDQYRNGRQTDTTGQGGFIHGLYGDIYKQNIHDLYDSKSDISGYKTYTLRSRYGYKRGDRQRNRRRGDRQRNSPFLRDDIIRSYDTTNNVRWYDVNNVYTIHLFTHSNINGRSTHRRFRRNINRNVGNRTHFGYKSDTNSMTTRIINTSGSKVNRTIPYGEFGINVFGESGHGIHLHVSGPYVHGPFTVLSNISESELTQNARNATGPSDTEKTKSKQSSSPLARSLDNDQVPKSNQYFEPVDKQININLGNNRNIIISSINNKSGDSSNPSDGFGLRTRGYTDKTVGNNRTHIDFENNTDIMITTVNSTSGNKDNKRIPEGGFGIRVHGGSQPGIHIHISGPYVYGPFTVINKAKPTKTATKASKLGRTKRVRSRINGDKKTNSTTYSRRSGRRLPRRLVTGTSVRKERLPRRPSGRRLSRRLETGNLGRHKRLPRRPKIGNSGRHERVSRRPDNGSLNRYERLPRRPETDNSGRHERLPRRPETRLIRYKEPDVLLSNRREAASRGASHISRRGPVVRFVSDIPRIERREPARLFVSDIPRREPASRFVSDIPRREPASRFVSDIGRALDDIYRSRRRYRTGREYWRRSHAEGIGERRALDRGDGHDNMYMYRGPRYRFRDHDHARYWDGGYRDT